jgi:hypothetical protein
MGWLLRLQGDPMSEIDDRAELARRDGLLVGIAGFGALNGMPFSPYFLPSYLFVNPFVQVTFFTSSPVISRYLTALLLSTFIVMLAGIPAAIFERVTGRERGDSMTYAVWFGAIVLISLPTLFAAASRGV